MVSKEARRCERGPPRVEYALTPLGKSLLDVVGKLIAWSEMYAADIDRARTDYDQRSGDGLSHWAAAEGLRSRRILEVPAALDRAGRRTMLSMARVAAALAAVIVGCAVLGAASGCSAPDHTYVANRANKTYFKVPASWHEIDEGALKPTPTGASPTPESAGAWG